MQRKRLRCRFRYQCRTPHFRTPARSGNELSRNGYGPVTEFLALVENRPTAPVHLRTLFTRSRPPQFRPRCNCLAAFYSRVKRREICRVCLIFLVRASPSARESRNFTRGKRRLVSSRRVWIFSSSRGELRGARSLITCCQLTSPAINGDSSRRREASLSDDRCASLQFGTNSESPPGYVIVKILIVDRVDLFSFLLRLSYRATRDIFTRGHYWRMSASETSRSSSISCALARTITKRHVHVFLRSSH